MPHEDKEQEEEQRARTAYDLIRMRLDRLQKNIDKPVSIPQRRDGRKPRPPPDFVRNVVGSSAAAGSAEFHIFRNNRKREMDRLDYMNQKTLQEQLDAEFAAKRAKKAQEEEMKTAKKRSKRQKCKERMKLRRKLKKKKSGDHDNGDDDNDDDDDDEDSGSLNGNEGKNNDSQVRQKNDNQVSLKADELNPESTTNLTDISTDKSPEPVDRNE